MDEDELSRSAFKLSWLWVIEYVASLQEIDHSILHGLIAEAPKFLEDLGKDTREMVALRCLEVLFGSKNEGESNVPSAAKAKFTFDISTSCEDVLLSILKETSISDLRTGSDLMNWDIQPFIVQKRTTMPKTSLERLKDELLEGAHPCYASLIEHSGLMYKDEDNDQRPTDCFQQNVGCRDDNIGTSKSLITAQKGSTVSLPLENGDSHHQIFLPRKRSANVLDNENQADYPKDQGDGDLHLNVKRFKCNASSVNEAAELTLTPQFDNAFVEESSKRTIETTENESLHAERGEIEGLGKCESLGHGHEKFFAADSIVRNANPDAIYEIEHNQCGNADDAAKMPVDTFGDGPCLDIRAGEVNEAAIRNGTSSGRILQKVYVDDSRGNSNCENRQKIDVSSSGFPKEISVENSEDGADCLFEEDTSSDGDDYRHEKVDVAMERSRFLSSHCTLSHVSLSNCTKLSLCVKCCKDGQMLVCNAVDCAMAVHEKCLGCPPRFDEKGNFYCPYCSYSYAISKYKEAKTRAASAKKELARFIHKDLGRSLGKKHHNVKQKLRAEESDETNGRHDNNQPEMRNMENKFQEPFISCADVNLMQREEETDITHGMNPISSAEKESEGMALQHLSERGLKFDIANRPCRDEEIPINEKEGEGGIKKKVVGQQSNDLLEKPVGSDGGNITNEVTKEEKVFSETIRLHLRRAKKQYVSPEWISPKREPWTAEEEQMLKEGVKKFSIKGEKIPWKKILEYGSSVFLGSRSAGKLKEKWRNMEKASLHHGQNTS